MASTDIRRGLSPDVAAADCHAHVMRRDWPLTSQRHSGPKYDVPVEWYLAELDRHGVTYGVLTAPSFYGSDNALLLQALRFAQGRLRGTAIVEPTIDDDRMHVMARAGVVGIRLNWFKRDALADVGSPEYRSLFRRVHDLGWHIEIYLEGQKLAALLPRLREHGAPVVVDHFGSPDPAKGTSCPGFHEVLKGIQAGDTYVKLTGPYRLGGADPRRYVEALVAAANGRRIVWGSDFPFVSYEDSFQYDQCVGWIKDWVPDAPTRSGILVDTPAELFGFPAAPR